MPFYTLYDGFDLANYIILSCYLIIFKGNGILI